MIKALQYSSLLWHGKLTLSFNQQGTSYVESSPRNLMFMLSCMKIPEVDPAVGPPKVTKQHKHNNFTRGVDWSAISIIGTIHHQGHISIRYKDTLSRYRHNHYKDIVVLMSMENLYTKNALLPTQISCTDTEGQE